MRLLAERLIAFDETEDNSADAMAPAFRACEKLRPHLTTLMGSAGFNALLGRAHVLAKVEVAWLRRVKLNLDGTCEDLEKIFLELEPHHRLEGQVVMLACLLGLLVTFIGEHLTFSLVSQVWPRLPHSDLDFEDREEK